MSATVSESRVNSPVAESIATFKYVLKVDAILFVIIVFLALLGVGITNYRVDNAYSYWSYMLVFMAVMTTAWGCWRSKKLGLLHSGKLLYQQAILWGAALVAVAIIYRLLEAGRVNVGTTGLLVLLMLTFATFVDGMLVSWKLYAVGALLLLTLLMAAYVVQFLWVILFAAVVLIALVLVFVVWKIRSY